MADSAESMETAEKQAPEEKPAVIENVAAATDENTMEEPITVAEAPIVSCLMSRKCKGGLNLCSCPLLPLDFSYFSCGRDVGRSM